MWLKFPRPFGVNLSVLTISLILSCSYLHGQNLIGYNYMEIKKFMNENRKDMHFNTVHNNTFSYLKYSDNYDSQTLLFFLTPDSVCKSERLVFDRGLKSQKLKELDENYVKVGKDRWMETRGSRKYLLKFIEEEWSCTIMFEPEN
jgi:hypothetical protein